MIRKILFVFLLISLFSCNRDSYPFIGKEVRETIVLSGINNVELMKAIVKYTNRKDSLKLEMCFYLIKEMKNHSHKTYLLRDSLGQLVDYNISEFNSINEVIEHKNSVINKSGEVRFYRHYNGEDVYKITGVYIVNQVERAFASGYYNIYEDKIGCELVKKYVLPYRLNDSEISIWKEYFAKRYVNLKYESELERIDKIKADINVMLHYDSRYVENPTDQELVKILQTKKGRSEDAATLSGMALRSQGIPAAIDYVPLPLEEAGKLCYWNVVWNKKYQKKVVYPFGDSLEKYQAPPKVFRRLFESNRELLPSDTIYNSIEFIHFQDGCYEDVTQEYNNVTDIVINDFAYRDSINPVFLKAFYNNKWVIVDWKYPAKEMLFEKIVEGYKYAIFDNRGKVLRQKIYPQPQP